MARSFIDMKSAIKGIRWLCNSFYKKAIKAEKESDIKTIIQKYFLVVHHCVWLACHYAMLTSKQYDKIKAGNMMVPYTRMRLKAEKKILQYAKKL